MIDLIVPTSFLQVNRLEDVLNKTIRLNKGYLGQYYKANGDSEQKKTKLNDEFVLFLISQLNGISRASLCPTTRLVQFIKVESNRVGTMLDKQFPRKG